MKYNWNLLSEEDVDNIEDVIMILAKNRQIPDVHDFLDVSIKKLYDPHLFQDMEKVVTRIQESIAGNELIYVYGDYDSDGITSSSIMVNSIRRLNGLVKYFIPNRFDDGYGLNLDSLDVIIQEGTKLLITVDCGINAHEEIKYLNKHGVDVIVSDHHEINYPLPDAYGIIHPLNKLDQYPCNCLSGAGVAFKISMALLGPDAYDYLDLAAIGTISDAVNLFDENRIIVANGLRFMSKSRNEGLKHLIHHLKITDLTEETVGFVIGPRFNAAGRLENASIVVDLLTTEEHTKIHHIIRKIEDINEERKIITQNVYDECIDMIYSKNFDRSQSVYVLYGESFHEGVNGIVAARILEQFKKPTIIFSQNGDTLKGSMRTATLNCMNVFNELDDLILRSGGHENAGGLSIRIEDLDAFVKRINEIDVIKNDLEIKIDCKLDYSNISFRDIYRINDLSPFGEGNPKPVFLFENIEIRKINAIGKTNNHTRIVGARDEERNIDIIFFHQDLTHEYFYKDTVSVCGYLNINDYNGFRKLQIMGIDIKK